MIKTYKKRVQKGGFHMSKRIITINRMYGSGGRVLGKALAEKLGYAFYDKELIELAGKEKQIPFHELAKVDEKSPISGAFPEIMMFRSPLTSTPFP